MYPCRPTIPVTLALGAAALATGCFSHVLGATSGSRFGWSVVAFGQLDNDNYDDYAVGAPLDSTANTGAGAVYAYLGSSSETKVAPAPGGVHWTGLGVDANEQAGFALAKADFDGDGNPDLAVGAPYKADPSGLPTGAVYIVSGEHVRSGGTFSLADAECVIYGFDGGDQFGWALAADDLDGDGWPDLAVGAPGADGNRGEVRAFYLDPGVFANCPEVIDADVTIVESKTARLGHALLVADTSGNGYGTLFAGAPYRDASRGRVYGYQLGVLQHTFTGAATGDRAGWALGTLDVDADDIDDLAMGAPGADRVDNGATVSNAGAAYVVFGSGMVGGSLGNAAVVDAAVLGTAKGDALGWSLGRLDYLAGSYPESLLVGAPLADNNGANSGSVYLLSRAELLAAPFPGVVLGSQARVDGSTVGGRLGFSVAGAGDLDHSGLADAIGGEPYTTAGRVTIGGL